MITTAVFALLAALGAVTAVWCLIGVFLLPAAGNGYVLIRGEADHGLRAARSCLFLRRCGLLRLPICVVTAEKDLSELPWLLRAAEDMELSVYTPESWGDIMETERR